MDRDEKKFEAFLSYHRKTMTASDLRVFVPFSINLDPYVRKVIKEEVQNMQDLSGMPFDVLAGQAAAGGEAGKANTGRQVFLLLMSKKNCPDATKEFSAPVFEWTSRTS